MKAKKHKIKKTMNDRAHDVIVEMSTSLFKAGIINEAELNGFKIKIPRVKNSMEKKLNVFA